MMKKKEILENIIELEDKYFDLVWYARKTEEDYNTIPKAKENMDRIQNQYPDEVASLYADDSNWEHGFNSGMLAGMRYIMTLFETGPLGGKEMADEEFPFLDT
jgi:hypothetical protein